MRAINSGMIGFSDREAFFELGELINRLIKHERHKEVFKWFGDQPFFNYALIKCDVAAYNVLAARCRFVNHGALADGGQAGFSHFAWPRSENKVKEMKAYFEHLCREYNVS